MIRATKGTSMDGEVLIIGRVVGWSGGIPKGLTSGGVRTWSVSCGGFFFSTYFRAGFWSVFFRFLVHFGRIWKRFWMDFDGILWRFLKLFERIWKDKQ